MRLVLTHSRLYSILSNIIRGHYDATFLVRSGVGEVCLESISRSFGGSIFSCKSAIFSTTNNTMKKTIQNQRGGVSYAAPACEIIDLVSETAVLQASTNSFTIQEWEDDEESLTF